MNAAFTGVVLAGGASRRMGQDKALVPVGGRPMARIVADVLAGAGAAEVVVVGGDRSGLARLGLDVRPDRWPGEGPLGGLLSAFAEAAHDLLVVLACDLPRADPAGVLEVLTPLVADPRLGAVVPVTDRLEPLHAAYRRSVVAAPAADAFASGVRSIHRALTEVPVATVRLTDPAWLHNANTPADLPR